MILLNELKFENDKHVSTRIVKTFPSEDRKHAEQYLENCLMLAAYTPTKEKYELKEI